MPSVRSLDRSARESKREASSGMCEPAQVHYPRKRCENWPFKYYTENGRIYQNTVPRQHKPDLTAVEEAPF